MSTRTSGQPLAPNVHRLRRGDVSLQSTIAQSCKQIEAVEHEINALVPEPRRNERLRAEATVLERQYPDPTERPPLYGILVGVKDVIHVNGLVTLAGSVLPPDVLAGLEASGVRALKAAGVLILGKTVTAEFACTAPNSTRNPHHSAHTPGGSSSGSAAAVAAGYCQLALGTQTVGSVIRPAAFCGVVGFKPTYERIPKDGIIDYSPTVDTIGMFTQDIAGMAIAASVLCRGWQSSASSSRPTLGVPEGPYLDQASVEGREMFVRQITALEHAGYQVLRQRMFDDLEQIMEQHYRIATAEMAMTHRDWYALYADLYRPETVAVIEKGMTVTAAEYAEAKTSPDRVRRQIEDVMEAAGIDLWVCPAALGPAPEGIESTGSPFMNLVWTHSGFPAVTVPAGRAANGLPLGLQLVGRYNADENLLAWAEGIEVVMREL